MKLNLLLLTSLLTLASCHNALLAPNSVQDESAYITGTIISRDDRFNDQRSALVAAEPTDPEDRRRAHVFLEGSPSVLWRDGRTASIADLRPGRVVSVWVTGPELRSYPPIVSAHTIIIER